MLKVQLNSMSKEEARGVFWIVHGKLPSDNIIALRKAFLESDEGEQFKGTALCDYPE